MEPSLSQGDNLVVEVALSIEKLSCLESTMEELPLVLRRLDKPPGL